MLHIPQGGSKLFWLQWEKLKWVQIYQTNYKTKSWRWTAHQLQGMLSNHFDRLCSMRTNTLFNLDDIFCSLRDWTDNKTWRCVFLYKGAVQNH